MANISTTVLHEKDNMLEEILANGPKAIELVPGNVVPGRVVAISRGKVLVDLGGTTTGIVSGKELIDAFNTVKGLEVGSEVTVFILEDENEEVSIENASPQDLIDSGFSTIETQVKTELLDKLNSIPSIKSSESAVS